MRHTKVPGYLVTLVWVPSTRWRVALASCASALLAACCLTASAAPAAASASADPAVPAVYAWGVNQDDQLGVGPAATSPTSSSVPLEVSLPSGVGVTAISSAGGTTLALGSDGDIYAWGWNVYGQLGNGSTTDSGTPVQVPLPNGVAATAVDSGGLTSAALGSDGNIYAWGDNISPPGAQANYSSVPVQVPLPGGLHATAVSVGASSILALGSDGNMYEWDNDGSGTNLATPIETSLPGGVATTAISGGGVGGTTLAIGSDGNVYAWGNNQYGQLGDGSTTSSSTPVRVSLPAGVTAVTVTEGEYASFALGSDGNIYAWGYSDLGQLGNGSTTDSSTPVRVLLPSGVTATAISSDNGTTLALGSDGTVYAWGSNLFLQLGEDSTGASDVPLAVSIPGGPTATAISEGADASFAITIGGTGPVSTTTTLTAAPDPAVQGYAATLTATVSASDGSIPTGVVQFEAAGTNIGSPVAVNSSGVASETATFEGGSYAVFALFTPTSSPYAPSSATLALTVIGPQTAGNAPVTITVPPAGSFAITIPTSTASLTPNSAGTQATGTLGTVTVTDSRNTYPGWAIYGEETTDFVGSGLSPGAPVTSISADDLAWTPAGTLEDGATFGPSPAYIGPNAGPRVLAQALAGSGFGTDTLDPTLTLTIPVGTPVGTYTGGVVITYIETAP
jgi:alpha-tubulin suppressor-like RCC1 family protein